MFKQSYVSRLYTFPCVSLRRGRFLLFINQIHKYLLARSSKYSLACLFIYTFYGEWQVCFFSFFSPFHSLVLKESLFFLLLEKLATPFQALRKTENV